MCTCDKSRVAEDEARADKAIAALIAAEKKIIGRDPTYAMIHAAIKARARAIDVAYGEGKAVEIVRAALIAAFDAADPVPPRSRDEAAMSEVLEKVARALAEATGLEGSADARSPMGDWPMWHDFRPQAKAALEVLASNVTPEMVDTLRSKLDNTLNLHGWDDDEAEAMMSRALAAAIRAAASPAAKEG
jgi:hypothetical protein